MTRVIWTGDAFATDLPRPSAVFTSLPDDGEAVGANGRYGDWFRDAVAMCLNLTHDPDHPDDGRPAVFAQTDRLADGATFAKAMVVSAVAADYDYRVVWHKILLKAPPGTVPIRRPTFIHAIAVAPPTVRPGRPTPDVLPPEAGVWRDAPGANQILTLARWVTPRAGGRVVDPFCGYGHFLAAVEACGDVDTIGVEHDPARAEVARRMTIPTPLEWSAP